MGRVRDSDVSVSHLLFVDDTLGCTARLFVSSFSHGFPSCFRLRDNIPKSEILPLGNVENIDFLASLFGCKVAYLPTSYLRLLLESSLNARRSRIERFECCLASWKKQFFGYQTYALLSKLKNTRERR